MKKQSFITGAFLLAVATGLGKIFSAVFKIPLDRFFLHAEGMAIFNGAYNVYTFFFAIATAGIPLALSRQVASATSKDEEDTAFSTALIFTAITLSMSALIIFIFSDTIAGFTGMKESAFAFRVMAPALVFCAATASLRGYFQGKMVMLPPALSQVCDSFGRLIGGFVMAFALLSSPLHITSAGAIAGVPFGAFISAVVLIISAKIFKLHISFKFSRTVLKELLALAIPITLTASLHPIFNMSDTITVVPFLSFLKSENALQSFGCLSRASTLYALPVSIATAVATSALPAVAQSSKNNDDATLNTDTSMALRLALAISVPCAAGFMAIAPGILDLLYDNHLNYMTLVFIGPSAVFLSIGEVMACILQGLGKTKYTVISVLVAVITKLMLNPALMSVMGVNGAALSTTVSHGVFVILLFVFAKKTTPVKFRIRDLIAKPCLCGLICFTAAYISHPFVHTVISIIIAAFFYIPSVFGLNLIKFKEIQQNFLK